VIILNVALVTCAAAASGQEDHSIIIIISIIRDGMVSKSFFVPSSRVDFIDQPRPSFSAGVFSLRRLPEGYILLKLILPLRTCIGYKSKFRTYPRTLSRLCSKTRSPGSQCFISVEI